jgi:hypothetical protein
MLQASVPNILSVFQTYVVSVFYVDVAYVLHMLQVFYLHVAYICNDFQVFLGVFGNVSNACFKCFIYLLLYVANVVSECFKNR